MKRELVALLLLSFGCLFNVNVLWLFLTVPWVGLQFVIFPDHTHLLFVCMKGLYRKEWNLLVLHITLSRQPVSVVDVKNV